MILQPSPPAASPRRESGAQSHWDRYLDLLLRKDVPEIARRWYLSRAEGFLEAIRPGGHLRSISPEHVTGYFSKVSSEGKLVDWQFRQLVDAVQLLVVDLAGSPAGREVDWDYWKAAGQGLDPHHPTLAKAQPPEETAEPAMGPVPVVVPPFEQSVRCAGWGRPALPCSALWTIRRRGLGVV